MIDPATLDEIKARVDLVALIAADVPLKKQGRDYYGECPFHAGDSFNVIPAKKFWFCHGCGESGDAFAWLMKHRGLNFKDAVRELAQLAGVHLNGAAAAPIDKAKYDAWKADNDARVAEMRTAEQADQERQWAEAAKGAAARWQAASTTVPADHPYLVKKRIQAAPDVRYEAAGQLLVIPLYDVVATKEIVSVQTIGPDGAKLYHTGARKNGTRFVIIPPGAAMAAKRGEAPFYIAEGYATAAAVAQVTGCLTMVALDTSNLAIVAAAAREKNPKADIVIAADNDRWTASGKGRNPGIRAANEAARQAGGRVAFPTFTTGCTNALCKRDCGAEHPTDWNDMLVLAGAAELRAQIGTTYTPDEVPPELLLAPTALPAEERERDEISPKDLSDDGLALALGEKWKETSRHVAEWGYWTFYNGQRWVRDVTLQHMTYTREFMREKADALLEWAARKAAQLRAASGDDEGAKQIERFAEGHSRRLRSKQAVAAVIDLTRSNPNQVATVAQWDADLMVLGTPAGTIDLRTGELRPARPDDYITRTTVVSPAPPGTPCPLWSKFLADATLADEGLESYLQRFSGYALTGLTIEHVFGFGHGPGGGGKGTFLNTIKAIMGEYAQVIATEALVVSHNDRHAQEIARLQGARLVVGSETEEGTRWAEAKIKRLTGGDPITANFMRQNSFDFIPQFKLFIIGNHRPTLRNVDKAMRRRLHLIPFEHQLAEEDKDVHLPAKLVAEYPAILRWMMDGCVAWQECGLAPPDAVLAASADYFHQEDTLAAWIDECATDSSGAWEASSSLWSSWRAWCELTGLYARTQPKFSKMLEERGFVREKKAGIRGYLGIKLNQDQRVGVSSDRRYGG